MTAKARLEFGARVRRVRERLGMSQTAFAASLGIAKGGLSMIEAGKRRPSLDFLVALEQVFGVEPSEITHGTPPPDPFVTREEKATAIEEPMKRPLTGAQRDVMGRVERGFAEGWLGWIQLSRFLHEAESRAAPVTISSPTPPKIAESGAGRLEQKLSRRKAGLVPLVRIAAGVAIEALDASETGEYVAPPPWLEEEKIDVALRVVGDSMTEEGLRHDDVVFVRRRAWSSGGIAVARRRSTNEITLKQVFSRGAEIELRSASERDIAPMRWPAADSELHGVEVVGMWRPSWHADERHS